MKKVMWLGAILLGRGWVNAIIEFTKECGCQPECWCKQPGFRYFRWVFALPSSRRHARGEAGDRVVLGQLAGTLSFGNLLASSIAGGLWALASPSLVFGYLIAWMIVAVAMSGSLPQVPRPKALRCHYFADVNW